MKSFKDFLAESVRFTDAPVTEDLFDFELDGLLIESEVIEHDDNSITVLVDEKAMAMLESLNLLEAINRLERSRDIGLYKDLGDGYWIGADLEDDGDVRKTIYSLYHLEDPKGAQDEFAPAWEFINNINVKSYNASSSDVEQAGKELKAMHQKDPVGATWKVPVYTKPDQTKDEPNTNISPMAEMLRLAGLPVEEDDVEETIKPGTKVKIHAPGKDYHDQVGHVGEIRRGLHNKAPKTYTVDYGDRKSVQLDKKNIKVHKEVDEAEYRGRKVPLGKPMRGDVKKFKVYVKDPKTGNVKKVNFGDPNMRIRKSDPARRRSFRARHNCKNPGPRTKARYWSCRKW